MTDNFDKLMKTHEESPKKIQKKKRKKRTAFQLGCGTFLLAIFGSIITGFWPGLFIFSFIYIIYFSITEKIWEFMG